MRAIGKVSDESDARRVSSYLLTLGIVSQIDPGKDGYVIWVRDEDKVELGREELAAFLQNPADARYHGALEKAELIRRQADAKLREFRKNVRDVQGQWRRSMPQSCPFTIALMAVCLVVAAVSQLGREFDPLLNVLFVTRISDNGDMVRYQLGLPEIRRGEVWRLATPMFIHFGTLHLLFNMWNFYSLAGIVELRRGKLKFVLLVLFTSIVSNMAQYAYHGPVFGGMSGVLYGLFGYIWMKSRYDPSAGMFMPMDTVVLMIGWMFLCMTGHVGPIANAAHVAGLAAGMLVGYSPIEWRRMRLR